MNCLISISPNSDQQQWTKGRGLSDRPVVVPEAVDLVLRVDSEGNAVQALAANDAAEAAGVVGLPQSLQDLRNEESVSQSVCLFDGVEAVNR